MREESLMTRSGESGKAQGRSQIVVDDRHASFYGE